MSDVVIWHWHRPLAWPPSGLTAVIVKHGHRLLARRSMHIHTSEGLGHVVLWDEVEGGEMGGKVET